MRYEPDTRGSVPLMNSAPVQRKVLEGARRALSTFRAIARAHSRTGAYERSGRLSRTTYWDGRKGYRLEAVANAQNAPIPIETGTSDTPAEHALTAARHAAGRVGRGRGRVL